jgi:SAM-dependent methyltransferase
VSNPERDAVRGYYESFGRREWQRLEQEDDGAVEFALQTRFLARWLPPGGRVLDLGGGPGRQTIWLAQHGHRVVLGDLSPTLLAIAREQIAAASVSDAVEAILELDATDLSALASGSFDAVLALGPFYHLPSPADRELAAREIKRVLRPGGVLLAAVMPRYVRLLAAVFERGASVFPEAATLLLEEGIYHDERPGRFTGAYLFRPDEVAPFFASHGFGQLALLASQGILGLVQEEAAALRTRDPLAHERLLEVAAATAGDPSILGLSTHLLYVGRKTEL